MSIVSNSQSYNRNENQKKSSKKGETKAYEEVEGGRAEFPYTYNNSGKGNFDSNVG